MEEFATRTQRIAVGAAFLVSLLISMMGVRAIEMLVDPQLVASIPAAQRNLFVRVDIVITALLLTGGAEGIHKVVSAFTTFMEATKSRLEERPVVVTDDGRPSDSVTTVSVDTRVEASNTAPVGG